MAIDLRRLFALLLPALAACTTDATSTGTGGSANSTGPGQECSGDSPTTSAGGSNQAPSPDLAAACKNLFDKRVTYATSCTRSPDPPSSEPAFLTLCAAIATSNGSLVTIADIDACATQVAHANCALDGSYPTCTGGQALLFPTGDKKGTASPSTPCVAGLQCMSGHCDTIEGPCGRCKRGRSPGETCSTPGDICEDSTCLQGGTCGIPGTGLATKCIQYGGSSGCAPGLVCATLEGIDGEGLCSPTGKPGDTCKATFQCEDGLFCDEGHCAPRLDDGACCTGTTPDQCFNQCIEGTCRKSRFNQKEGQSCRIDQCEEGLLCNGLICTSQDFLAKGETCWSGSAYTGACSPDLLCDLGCNGNVCTTPRTCVEFPPIGAPCVGFAECGPEAKCLGWTSSPPSPGICTKRGHENDPCPCTEDLVCSNNKCVPFGPSLCNQP